jgi:O-antigen ligase
VTDVSERFGLSPLWLACLASACVATGWLSGIKPEYGLLAAGGMVFAAVVMTDLSAGFALFTGLSFLDLLSSSGSFSGTKVIGVLLFVSWLARTASRRGVDLASFLTENPLLTFAMVAMLGWCALSFAWAESPSAALGGAGRYLLDMLLVPIAFAAVRERKHVVWVLAAFVIGAVFSSLYGFLNPATAVGARLTGSIGDPNEEGTVLAAAIPLLICIVGVIRSDARVKLAALVGLAILFAGLVDTLSRGALLSFAAVMVAAVIFGGRWRGRAAALLLIGVVATCGYFFLLAPLTARERVTMSDTSGRSSIWTVAWRVIKAHPVLGVGMGNFILVEGRYVNQPGAIEADYVVDQPHVAHDVFVESLADLGVPGVLTLLAVLGLCISAVVRAIWIFERLGDRQMELTSRAVVLGLVAVLTSDFFVSSEYAKSLWILLAMCPVLLGFARRDAAQVGAA